MSISSEEWKKFEESLSEDIADAAAATDQELASKIATLTRMTEAEITRLFPKKADKETLVELMKIVTQAGKRQTKINKLVSNAEQFAGIALTLLKKLV